MPQQPRLNSRPIQPPSASPASLLTISPARVLRALLAAVALLTVLGIAGELSRNFAAGDRDLLPRTLRVIRRNFNPSAEQTVGSWFTAGLLLLSGGLFAFIAIAARAAQDRFVPHWRALAVLLVFLSCDEAASLHEQLGDWVGDALPVGGILLWAWVIPYSFFAIAAALAFIPLVRDLPPDTRRRILVAAVLYVGGALGFEMVQAGITDARGQGGGPVTVLAVIEESAEMLGAALLVHALLRHLAAHVPIQLSVANEPETAPISGIVAPDVPDGHAPPKARRTLSRPDPVPRDVRRTV